MIYFYKEKIELAKGLIDSKSMYDDIKAAKDLAYINFALENALSPKYYLPLWD